MEAPDVSESQETRAAFCLILRGVEDVSLISQFSDTAQDRSTLLTVRVAALSGPRGELRKEFPLGSLNPPEDLDRQLRGKGMESLLDADTYLDALTHIEHAAREPGFLLRAGLTQDLSRLGLFGKSMVHSETLWDAIQRAVEGMAYFQAGSSVRVGLRMDRFRLEYSNAYGKSVEATRDCQYFIALFFNLVRLVWGYRSANPVVRFPRCKPEHVALFPDALRVTPATRGVIEIDSFLLRQRLKQGNADLSAAIARTIACFDGYSPSFVDVVRQLQASALHEMHSPISLDAMSRILSIPSRTLQLELRRNGHSFASLRDQARHEAARRELWAGRSVDETAERLGYAQRQSFSEAFSRWEGTPPSAFASRGRGASISSAIARSRPLNSAQNTNIAAMR